MNHGTFTAYTKGRCRCEPCTAANREYRREWGIRRKRNEAAAKLGRLPVMSRMPMAIGITPEVESTKSMHLSSTMTFRQAVTARCSNCGATGKSNAAFGKKVNGCRECK